MTGDLPKLALLGLGTMGRAMAGSALRAGIPTVVWNRDPAAADGIVRQGAEFAPSVADAVREVDVVITMVTNSDAVMSIATEREMLVALPKGAVWAQMSTIGIDGTERLADLVRSQRPDLYFVDAPVSGSKVPAEQGKLVIFASGPKEAQPRLAPIFEAVGQKTIWLGSAGNGSRMKLVNNSLLAFTAEGVANSLALADRMGLETASVVEAFDGSPLMSAWESGKLRRIAKGDFSPEFALNLALKDVHLALSAGSAEQFPVLAALADEWDEIVDHGLGGEDVTVVTRALRGDS
jgi:3-hydroxyisobutyrate dehydrogenase